MGLLDGYKQILQDYKEKVVDEVREKVLGEKTSADLEDRQDNAKKRVKAEVDTSRGTEGLQDVSEDINRFVNEKITIARNKIPKYKKNIQKFLKEVYLSIGKAPTIGLKTPIEEFIYRFKEEEKKRTPKLNQTKYRGNIYKMWGISALLSLVKRVDIVTTNIRLYNISVGADKFGHFFEQGYEYYDIKINRKDITPEEYGIETEKSFYGMGYYPTKKIVSNSVAIAIGGTGIFSNADLFANKQGMSFYMDLAENPDINFDISTYFDKYWNEEENPNFYSEQVATQIWGNILEGRWTGTVLLPYQENHLCEMTFIFKSIIIIPKKSNILSATYEITSSINKNNIVKGKLTASLEHVMENVLNAVKGIKILFNSTTYTTKGYFESINEQTLVGYMSVDDLKSKIELQKQYD